MQLRVLSIAKLVAVVIVGIFVFKLVSKTLVNKWPNAVTNAIDSVVQTA